MLEESKVKNELEDKSMTRKVSLLPVSNVDDQLIKTRKSNIYRIVLENSVHFEEEHSEELESNTIQMNLLKK